MNEKIKNTLLVTMVILLLSACGGLEPAPASIDTPEPVSTETAIDTPTTIPLDEPASDASNKYIGLVYPPSPDGLSKSFGMMIWDTDGYGLSLVSDGAGRMLWLEKIIRYDENGNAFWEVKDVLDLSNVETGLTLVPDGCSLNGASDGEIIAAGRNGVILLAWRANTALEKFEIIPVDGITCNSDKAINLD